MEKVFEALRERVSREPYAGKLGIELIDIKPGCARVRMKFGKEIENIFGMAHGGAVFSLIDEAFQVASNSHGTVAVALNVQVSYIQAAEPGETLYAEMKEVDRSKRLSHYLGEVKDSRDRLIATCQAVAYRKPDKLPFLDGL
jgi:acyl-CoA thioesterase